MDVADGVSCFRFSFKLPGQKHANFIVELTECNAVFLGEWYECVYMMVASNMHHGSCDVQKASRHGRASPSKKLQHESRVQLADVFSRKVRCGSVLKLKELHPEPGCQKKQIVAPSQHWTFLIPKSICLTGL